MPREIQGKHVINGSYGELWMNNEYMAEITGFEAVIEITYEDVNRPRKLGTAKKMMGYEGTGTINFQKVTSRFIRTLSDNLKQGKQTTVDMITKLDDPDALGAERIAVRNATFDNLTLANWEAKAKGEQDTSFSFEDWEPLDLIG